MSMLRKFVVAFSIVFSLGTAISATALEAPETCSAVVLYPACEIMHDADDEAEQIYSAVVATCETTESEPEQESDCVEFQKAAKWRQMPALIDAETPIYSMPVEVVLVIMSFVREKDLCKFRECSSWCKIMVNKPWTALSDASNRNWQMCYARNFDSPPSSSEFGAMFKSLARQCLSLFGCEPNNSDDNSVICWRRAFFNKGRDLAFKNSMKVWLRVWNAGTKEDKYFNGANISYLEPHVFSRHDFSYGKFIGADLTRSDVSNMDFTGALCMRAKFYHACLARTISSLGRHNVPPFDRKVVMKGCDVSGADFRGAFLFQRGVPVTLNELADFGCIWDPQEPPRVGH